MSGSDEAPKTRKRRRRRRRSLRVPVDEVPRPTALSTPPGFDMSADGRETLEIPAYDAPHHALSDYVGPARDVAENDEGLDEPLLRTLRHDGSDLPFEDTPTVVQPLETPGENDEFEQAPTLVLPERSADPSSVEVDLEVDEEADDFEVRPTTIKGLPEESRGAENGGATVSAPRERRANPEGGKEHALAVKDGDPPAKHSVPPLGVIVQRVVAVASTASTPPPPLDDEELVRADRPMHWDTVPGAELAVDVDDAEEPEITLDDDGADHGAADIDELEVELEHGLAAASRPLPPRPPHGDEEGSPADLSDQEAEALLEEEGSATKGPSSKPPPPPPNQHKAGTPPPPPAEQQTETKPAASPSAAPAAKRRKSRRQWWETLFNDDYLRTVPIPAPKTIDRQCDFIEQRFRLAPGATILDVGCGLGLHAVELTRRGYLVVGLDLSLPMLSRAADEAQEHGFKINFLHADMREMNFDGAFDAVLCWGTTLGYFDDETNKVVVERLYRALKPRGMLLLDVVNRDYVVRGQPNLVWFEGDGCVVMEETQMNYITSRLEVKRNVILDDGRQRDTVYSLRLYSLHELGQILHQQGFRVVEVTGREAHPGVFFGADSPKLIIMAERRPQGPPTPPGRSSSGEMQALRGEPLRGMSDSPSEVAELSDQDDGSDESEAPVQETPFDAGPSDDVSRALAETLESSEELDAGEELGEEELEDAAIDDARGGADPEEPSEEESPPHRE